MELALVVTETDGMAVEEREIAGMEALVFDSVKTHLVDGVQLWKLEALLVGSQFLSFPACLEELAHRFVPKQR